MNQKITYKAFIDNLKKINFEEKRMANSHLILFNKDYNATIVLPNSSKKEFVPIYLIKSSEKIIIEKGILSLNDFYNLFFYKNN